MSVNKYNADTGELVTLANGSRIWCGTKAAKAAAIAAGTMPNNCMVCVTDDYDSFQTPKTLWQTSTPTECQQGDTFTLSDSLENYASIVIEYVNGKTGVCYQRSFYFDGMFLNRMSLGVSHSTTQYAHIVKTSNTVLTVGGIGTTSVYITRILGRKS